MSRAALEASNLGASVSGASRIANRFFRQPVAVASLVYLCILSVVAMLAPLLAPYQPDTIDVLNRLQGPSVVHWLGTDDLGRDVFARIIYGARVALVASLQAVGIGMAIGVPLGLAAGYFGRFWDGLAMRAIDILDAIPGILFALTVIAALGAGLFNAMLAIGILFSGSFMRLTRAAVLAEREELYIDAARVAGLKSIPIMARHILPNIVPPLVVMTSILLGAALLIEAMLSFLGLGVDAGTPSWGGMLEDSRMYQHRQPFLVVPAGLTLTLTVLAFNLLGDGLRDAFGREANFSNTRSLRALMRARQQDSGAQHAVSQAATEQTPDEHHSSLLSVRGLEVCFAMPNGNVGAAVDDVSFDVKAGEFFGLVGESGCGKSTVASALVGLTPPTGQITGGTIRLNGRTISGLSEAAMLKIRGSDVGFIFQDAVASLAPTHQIGVQLTDCILANENIGRAAARKQAKELLDLVGIPNPGERLSAYPHQFSGGMAQRVTIAMALACSPKLLIADEPTTALDVTVQRRVLELLDELRDKLDLSILLITHDLGVVAEHCDRMAVMYAGQIVEIGDTVNLLTKPRHPYTANLLQSMPELNALGEPLKTVKGVVPAPWNWPTGCRFAPRCGHAVDICLASPPPFVFENRCSRARELRLEGVARND